MSDIIGTVNLILKSKEKFISFTKFIPFDNTNTVQLKFIDSFNSLSTGLDKLVKTLQLDDFQHLRLFFKHDRLFNLACRKNVYCYDYVDTWEKYDDSTARKCQKFLVN